MHNNKVLHSKEQIQTRMKELAKQIANDYANQPLLLISLLKGSFIFTADVQRALFEQGIDASVDFLHVSSYSGTKSSKDPKIISDITLPISGKHILLIDDILDTGHTFHFVKKHLEEQNPATVKLLVLLDKPEKREVDLHADYVGFTLTGSPWVEGYGLDTDELGRGNPDIVDKS